MLNKFKENKTKKEKKSRGNAGEVFVRGMAAILALLMVAGMASTLIFAIIFA